MSGFSIRMAKNPNLAAMAAYRQIWTRAHNYKPSLSNDTKVVSLLQRLHSEVVSTNCIVQMSHCNIDVVERIKWWWWWWWNAWRTSRNRKHRQAAATPADWKATPHPNCGVRFRAKFQLDRYTLSPMRSENRRKPQFLWNIQVWGFCTHTPSTLWVNHVITDWTCGLLYTPNYTLIGRAQLVIIITSPPTHSVGRGQYCFARCRLSSSVVACSIPHMQRNSHGGSTPRRASSVTSRLGDTLLFFEWIEWTYCIIISQWYYQAQKSPWSEDRTKLCMTGLLIIFIRQQVVAMYN